MNPSSREKYAARLSELEALHHELSTGKRPGDGAVVVGLLLEAAGDVLRRKATLGASRELVIKPLTAISEQSLRAWADGVQVADFAARLNRAASQAVEAAIPDSDDAGRSMAQWAMQDLQARDRLESALVALEAMNRADAKAMLTRLRSAVATVDRQCRGTVASFTALNGTRRAEAALLDTEFRASAWWYSERTGIEDDQLVQVLGGEAKGSLPDDLKVPSRVVSRKRARPVSFDDLLRFDLGLATPAEREILRRQADADPELKLALAAMEAAESAILEETKDEAVVSPGVVPVPLPVERSSNAPEIVEERSEFKVLLFRSKKNVQVVVQPHRLDRFAAAAVYRSDEPDRPFPSSPGDMGLHFDLGAPERLAGALARVIVKLTDGQTHAFEVRL
ncbi:MAG: hypothetical protein ACOZQL_30240 [Myxococcota bacterium]